MANTATHRKQTEKTYERRTEGNRTKNEGNTEGNRKLRMAKQRRNGEKEMLYEKQKEKTVNRQTESEKIDDGKTGRRL
jgi:hypothetical protein